MEWGEVVARPGLVLPSAPGSPCLVIRSCGWLVVVDDRLGVFLPGGFFRPCLAFGAGTSGWGFGSSFLHGNRSFLPKGGGCGRRGGSHFWYRSLLPYPVAAVSFLFPL